MLVSNSNLKEVYESNKSCFVIVFDRTKSIEENVNIAVKALNCKEAKESLTVAFNDVKSVEKITTRNQFVTVDYCANFSVETLKASKEFSKFETAAKFIKSCKVENLVFFSFETIIAAYTKEEVVQVKEEVKEEVKEVVKVKIIKSLLFKKMWDIIKDTATKLKCKLSDVSKSEALKMAYELPQEESISKNNHKKYFYSRKVAEVGIDKETLQPTYTNTAEIKPCSVVYIEFTDAEYVYWYVNEKLEMSELTRSHFGFKQTCFWQTMKDKITGWLDWEIFFNRMEA